MKRNAMLRVVTLTTVAELRRIIVASSSTR
jgi:hypothetical protein